jgi:hypothetical protein
MVVLVLYRTSHIDLIINNFNVQISKKNGSRGGKKERSQERHEEA